MSEYGIILPQSITKFRALVVRKLEDEQAKLTELTSYSPINVDAKPQLDDLAKSFLTTTPEREKDRFPLDIAWWAKNNDAMTSAYANWLAR